MKRSIVVLAALAILLVGTTSALASEATTVEAPSTDVPSTVVETVVPPTTDVPTTTEAPATTETPPTTTEVPGTTDVPFTGTEVPGTMTEELGTTIPTGCEVDCIPTSEELGCANCIPTGALGAGGIPTTIGAGRALPFTGIEDAIAPLLLALTVVLGGVVAWRWAQLRESVAEAGARRSETQVERTVRSGYTGAARQLEIEQRARRVFTARIA